MTRNKVVEILFTPSVTRQQAEALMESFRERFVDPGHDEFIRPVLANFKVDPTTNQTTSELRGYESAIDLTNTRSPFDWVVSQIRAHGRVASATVRP